MTHVRKVNNNYADFPEVVRNLVFALRLFKRFSVGLSNLYENG